MADESLQKFDLPQVVTLGIFGFVAGFFGGLLFTVSLVCRH